MRGWTRDEWEKKFRLMHSNVRLFNFTSISINISIRCYSYDKCFVVVVLVAVAAWMELVKIANPASGPMCAYVCKHNTLDTTVLVFVVVPNSSSSFPLLFPLRIFVVLSILIFFLLHPDHKSLCFLHNFHLCSLDVFPSSSFFGIALFSWCFFPSIHLSWLLLHSLKKRNKKENATHTHWHREQEMSSLAQFTICENMSAGANAE